MSAGTFIDWPLAIGLVCFVLVCLFALWASVQPPNEEPLPEPDPNCVACGEPMHTVQIAEWEVSPGYVRFSTTKDEQHV